MSPLEVRTGYEAEAEERIGLHRCSFSDVQACYVRYTALNNAILANVEHAGVKRKALDRARLSEIMAPQKAQEGNS